MQTHRLIAGKFSNDNILIWETACGIFIEDGSLDEYQIVPHHLSKYNTDVSCKDCSGWMGLMALRTLDVK